MDFSSDIEVKTVELPDALEFTVTREDGLYVSIVVPIICMIVIWYFWRIGPIWVRIFLVFSAVAGVASYIANLIHGRETKLLVRSDGIIARGNLGRIFSTRFQVQAADITKIRFSLSLKAMTQDSMYGKVGHVPVCFRALIANKLTPSSTRLLVDSLIRLQSKVRARVGAVRNSSSLACRS